MKKRTEKLLLKIMRDRENYYWDRYLEFMKSGDMQKSYEALAQRQAYKAALDCIEYAINDQYDCLIQFDED